MGRLLLPHLVLIKNLEQKIENCESCVDCYLKIRLYLFVSRNFSPLWQPLDFQIGLQRKCEFFFWLVFNPTLLLICSSFSRENGHPLLICSSLSTAQFYRTVLRLPSPPEAIPQSTKGFQPKEAANGRGSKGSTASKGLINMAYPPGNWWENPWDGGPLTSRETLTACTWKWGKSPLEKETPIRNHHF